jgi:hypothetical protein
LLSVGTSGPQDARILEIIERAAARNLLDYVHAARTVAPELKAAATGCAGGAAAFLGAGSPLTTVKGSGPDLTEEDIDAAEHFFLQCGAGRAIFEVAPWISAESSDRLRRRDYEVVGSENVVVRSPPFTAPEPHHHVVHVDARCWPELMLLMNDFPDSSPWRALAEASAILPGAIRFGVPGGGGAFLACAQIQPSAGVGLFGNDATLHSARRRGLHTATIQQRLRAAATLDFSCVAAEVAPGSASERNYLRCGFHLAYTRAHYARNLI